MFHLLHFWSFLLFSAYKQSHFHSDAYQTKNKETRESVNQLVHRTRWFPDIIISLILFLLAVTHEQLTLDRDLELIGLCLILICSGFNKYLIALLGIVSLTSEIIMHHRNNKLRALLHASTMFMIHVYLTALRMDTSWIFERIRKVSNAQQAKYCFQLLYEMRINPLMTLIAAGQQILAFHLWYSGIVKSIGVLSFQFVLVSSYLMALIWNYILCKDSNQLLLIPFIRNRFPDKHPFWAQFVTCLHLTLVISLILTLIV
ncbi:unnamed protein product [Adineta ricciae]|uniref:Uncharacterized protein n=1 Tax=Adineta ricciae TaxID=249248 RepID=A0A814FB93_ADIRI|nr:unnamed protein product [Adineta ricciae]